MNCKQINNIPFSDFLGKLGYTPHRLSNKEYWYLSPLREEKTASFKINIESNRFHDFGDGKKGTIIDFYCHLKSCNIPSAIEEISKLFSFPEHDSYLQVRQNKSQQPKYKSQIEVLAVKSIENPILKDYLAKRGLSECIYPYIKEINFTVKGKRNFAIGFANDKQGYELRNKIFKACTSKAITSIIKEQSQTLCIFEGFMDYLAYLEGTVYTEFESVNQWFSDMNESFIILNSLSMKEQAISYFKQFEKVNLYLDNDDAGRNLTTELMSSYSHIEDCSKSYSSHKDYNEYHLFKIQKMQEMSNAIKGLKL